MSLLKMKWGGSKKLVKFSPTKILYLTYFNDFDLTTKKDTPIKGPEIQFQTQYTFTKTTMNCMDVTMPALNARYLGMDSIRPQDSIQIPNSINEVSVESFVYIPYTTNQRGIGLLLGDTGKSIGCDPLGWGNFIGSLNDTSDRSVYNGASIEGYDGNGYFRLPINFYDNLRHYAQVFNYLNNEVRFYIDGDLYVKYTFDPGLSRDLKVSLMPRNNWSGTITQVAVFGDDKSINDGMNYPVPTEPYRNVKY